MFDNLNNFIIEQKYFNLLISENKNFKKMINQQVFVIKNGSLKEEGNFNSLIELNGSFKKMIDDQTFIV